MSRSPASIFCRSTCFGARRVADLEHRLERRARRTAVQRALERADRADDRRDEIRSRGRDHTAGERGRVEPVVDDGVQICLEAAHVLPVGHALRPACRG